MTHKHIPFVLCSFLFLACGGGSAPQVTVGDTTQPKISDQPPKISDQPPKMSGDPAVTSDQQPGNNAASASLNDCASICARAVAVGCDLDGQDGPDCVSDCEKTRKEPCGAEVLSLLTCALRAPTCPTEVVEGDEQLSSEVLTRCPTQVGAFYVCSQDRAGQ